MQRLAIGAGDAEDHRALCRAGKMGRRL